MARGREERAVRNRRAIRPGRKCGDPREEERATACTIGPGRRRGRSIRVEGALLRTFGLKSGDTREEERVAAFAMGPWEEDGTLQETYLP